MGNETFQKSVVSESTNIGIMYAPYLGLRLGKEIVQFVVGTKEKRGVLSLISYFWLSGALFIAYDGKVRCLERST